MKLIKCLVFLAGSAAWNAVQASPASTLVERDVYVNTHEVRSRFLEPLEIQKRDKSDDEKESSQKCADGPCGKRDEGNGQQAVASALLTRSDTANREKWMERQIELAAASLEGSKEYQKRTLNSKLDDAQQYADFSKRASYLSEPSVAYNKGKRDVPASDLEQNTLLDKRARQSNENSDTPRCSDGSCTGR